MVEWSVHNSLQDDTCVPIEISIDMRGNALISNSERTLQDNNNNNKSDNKINPTNGAMSISSEVGDSNVIPSGTCVESWW